MTLIRRSFIAAGVCAALGGVAASPAAAASGKRYVTTNFPDGSKGYISWKASCNSTANATYAPSWQAYMKEFGPSNVKDLKIEYDIYTAGTGMDTVKYQGTSYVKNVEEYGTYKGAAAGGAAYNTAMGAPIKTTRQRAQTSDVVLVVKFTFGRGIRKDTVIKQIVAYCAAGTVTSPGVS